MVRIERYNREHLDQIQQLAEREGWGDYASDPEALHRSFTAPGVIVLVALDGDEVVGYAQVLTDGCLRAYLALMLVHRDSRRQGIGRALLERARQESGTERMDLIASEDSANFYRQFPNRERRGFILHFGSVNPPTGGSFAGA